MLCTQLQQKHSRDVLFFVLFICSEKQSLALIKSTKIQLKSERMVIPHEWKPLCKLAYKRGELARLVLFLLRPNICQCKQIISILFFVFVWPSIP